AGGEAGGERVVEKGKPNLDRQAPLFGDIGGREAAHHRLKSKRRNLRAIGIRAQAKAARRRQSRLRQRRKVCRLRADALGIDSRSGGERDDGLRHGRTSIISHWLRSGGWDRPR